MAFLFPDHFRFADSHEYAFADEALVRIGISEFAVDQLGDIVFVDLGLFTIGKAKKAIAKKVKTK